MDIDDAMDLARAGDDEVELALCAEVKRLRAERDALKSQLYNSCEYERHDPEGCACPLGYRLTEVEAERDALLYSEHLHSEALGAAVKEAEELRAERDALKQDAERYRWLRRARMNVDVLVREDEDSVWLDMHGNDLDVYVDAALRGEGE